MHLLLLPHPTECQRDVLKEAYHNARRCATPLICSNTATASDVIEPSAVVSLLPISFGYDIPWMCEAYMDRELLRRTYQHLSALIGEGPSQDPDTSFKWHAMHFKYLLLTMLEDDRLTRMDLLRHDEVPPSSLAMTARCRRITCGRSTRALCPMSDATTRACSPR